MNNLNQTKKVFDTLADLIKHDNTCTYRYLIYDLLGFKQKDYVPLISGMTITNRLVEYETLKQKVIRARQYMENYIETEDVNLPVCYEFEVLLNILKDEDHL